MSEDLTAKLKRDPVNAGLWASWHKQMYPKVFSAVHGSLVTDLDAARDITQEAFVRFIQFSCLDKVHDDGSAAAYLRTICRNVASSRRSHERGRQDYSVEIDEMPEHDVNLDAVIDLDHMAKDLDPDDRHLFDMSRAGMSLGEIARELSITYTAAGVRLHRLLGRLKRTFAPEL